MKLSDMCKEIRKKMKISQKELALIIGTNQTEISFIERGFKPNDASKAKKIVEVFNGM